MFLICHNNKLNKPNTPGWRGCSVERRDQIQPNPHGRVIKIEKQIQNGPGQTLLTIDCYFQTHNGAAM